MLFSVIIPTLNEAGALESTLASLIANTADSDQVEIIVSDGGSDDDSLQRLRHFAIKIIDSKRGRARQMNAGAQAARGHWLVFLHADTHLPADWMALITNAESDWGRFDVRLSGSQRMLRIIERAMNWRSRLTAVCTGDQAMFFQRGFFQRLGGFPDIDLMEDIAISNTARKASRPACISTPVVTSSRRWETRGILRTTGLMWMLRLAYWAGVEPGTLHRLYYADRQPQ